MKNIIALFVYLALASTSLAAEQEKIKNEFYTGEIRLTKSFFDSSAFGRDELRDLYKNGKWEELVKTVLSKHAAWDTYYFYLGRAAEELGYKEAAITYYGLAINSEKNKKCDAFSLINLCDGFKFPDAAQTRINSLTTTTNEKYWEIYEAPLLTDLIKFKPETIDLIAQKPEQTPAQRSKFETDEEYKNRQLIPQDPYFMSFPLNTNEIGKCTSDYNHASGMYIIEKCVIFSEKKPILTLQETGEKFSLANAFDRRDIEKIIHKNFIIISDMTWNGKYKISRDEAAKLDSELMVAILFLRKTISIQCDICNSRDRLDASNDLINAISKATGKPTAIKNNGWKDQAFKEGKLEEFWDYKIKPENITKIFVYRNSDLRVIYEKDITPNK